jgi:hypothetical protein
MMDDTDLSQEKRWFHEEQAKTTVGNFQRKNMNAQYVSSKQEALAACLEMIPAGAKVGRGDSITIDQIGIVEALKKRGQNSIFDPMERDRQGFFSIRQIEERRRVAREVFSVDIFLVGANAITLDGELVNTDGWGNRVSAMIFGPGKVIVVAGTNKIVKDVNEALARIRNIAAPLNARRHFIKHQEPGFVDLPCVRTGSCVDCRHDWRICHYTVIIDGTMGQDKGRINVILVGEELGI